MKLNFDPIATSTVLARLAAKMGEGERAEGLHVSDLIMCLRKAWIRQRTGEVPLDYSTVLVFSVGRAMQDWLTGQIGDEVGIEKDGIHGTPDYRDGDGVLSELKATYYSSSKDIGETYHYHEQLGAYLAMTGELEGRLIVFYVNGDYKKDRRQMKVFDLQFTKEELDQWWSELLERKVILESAMELEDIPLEYHYTWECDYCVYKGGECPGGTGKKYGFFIREEV